ncbi:MAG: hypothetical protein EOO05_14850 [Chitinophagaceae bacterium]|nr:MAG: hypothetical protein EOO05_14850 [Chitinophagaceae bacterium]
MDLQAILITRHSKESTDELVHWVGESQKRFDRLFAFFTGPDARLAQVSAWPLSYCVIEHPSLIKKHWKETLENFEKPLIHDAIKRNTLRLLQSVEIPVKYHGRVMTKCFDLICSPAEKPAIKAFSLTVLANLATLYPEIREELITVIETQWPFEKAAFRSRARKILKLYNAGIPAE